jgi:O-antigen ligase
MTRINSLTFLIVCGIVAFTTLAYGAVHQPIIALTYILIAIAGVFWGFSLFTGDDARSYISGLQMPLLLLGIFGLLQVVPFGYVKDATGLFEVPRTISLEPNATQTVSVHILLLSLFFTLCLAVLNSATRLRRVATLVTVFGFVYSFYAILQAVLSPDKIYGIYAPAAVPFGSFVNRHNFAAVIEMAVSIPLGLLFAGAVERDKRLVYIVAVVIMGAALLLSGSRGGLVAFLLQLVFVVLISSRASAHRRTALKLALSALLVVGIVGGALFTGGDTSLTRFAESASRQNLSSDRFEIWAITARIIAEHLPFGTGLGAYATAFTRFDPSGGAFRVEQAHNDYLQVLSDAGLVGLILGALFLFLLVREGLRNSLVKNTFRRGIAVGAFTACFGVLVHSLFDFVLHTTAVSVWFLVIMCLLVCCGARFDDDIADLDEQQSRRRRHRRKASVTPFKEGLEAG